MKLRSSARQASAETDDRLILGLAASLHTPPDERCHVASWEMRALCGHACELPPDCCEYRHRVTHDIVCSVCKRPKCVDCIGVLRGWKPWAD